MTDSDPILLIPAPPRPADLRLRLPETNHNLFDRIIRDPRAPNRPARERLCTEMLCAILINAPTVRLAVLSWLAKFASVDYSTISALNWVFETERAIGVKRDDLRVEGWDQTESGSGRIVLWTIEVKVGAPLHHSSEQDAESEVSEAIQPEITLNEVTDVSQLVNYDRWLSQQDARHRTGFVLGISNLRASLPDGLKMPWHATTWGQLALVLERELAEGTIPDPEKLLTEHFAGFVRDRLWSDADMGSDNIDFDDLALIRAFASRGPSCFRKATNLTASLLEAVKNSGIAFEKIDPKVIESKGNEEWTKRFAIRGRLAQIEGVEPPSLYVGIVGAEAWVWFETSPKAIGFKKNLGDLIQQSINILKARNPEWSANVTEWHDLVLSKRLDYLLIAEDQSQSLQSFVKAALQDLHESGFVAGLNRLIT